MTYLFKGRVSKWYSLNHMKIIATAQMLARKETNLAFIGQITVSAYTSGSGMTKMTKGAAFKSYLELLPDAMAEIGQHDLGRRVIQDFDAITTLIENHGKSSVARSKQRKDKTLVSAQRETANALYEELLSAQSDHLRHALREATRKSDNKLVALTKLLG
uniref:Uncharacterized protein n=1 Tax=Pseudomonas phage Nican01 TaxID=3138540 RepID=A0AAU6W1G6_9CAUD